MRIRMIGAALVGASAVVGVVLHLLVGAHPHHPVATTLELVLARSISPYGQFPPPLRRGGCRNGPRHDGGTLVMFRTSLSLTRLSLATPAPRPRIAAARNFLSQVPQALSSIIVGRIGLGWLKRR
jgi:hypothetical protein